MDVVVRLGPLPITTGVDRNSRHWFATSWEGARRCSEDALNDPVDRKGYISTLNMRHRADKNWGTLICVSPVLIIELIIAMTAAELVVATD